MLLVILGLVFCFKRNLVIFYDVVKCNGVFFWLLVIFILLLVLIRVFVMFNIFLV